MTVIRLATAEDLPHLTAIEEAGDAMFAELFGGVDWPPPTPGTERAARPGVILVADRPVTGFAHVFRLDGHWHLEQLAVSPACQRRGVGGALLDAVLAEVARGGGREVTLMTYADVRWNGPFYARRGYVELDPSPAWMQPMRDIERRMGLERHGRRVAMVYRL
ncbi:MAG: GNAT family N-acetyltransferase, partial [Dermatophilaceae bacterium]